MISLTGEQMAALTRPQQKLFGLRVVAALQEDSPQTVLGLTNAEVDHRLDLALSHAQRCEMTHARDLRSFIRLCFVVGPNFSTYAPFRDLLATGTDRLNEMFDTALPEDWDRVALLDVLDRYTDLSTSTIATEQSLAQSTEGRITLERLTLRHSEASHWHGLHPDVWRLANASPVLSLMEVQAEIQEDERSGNRKRFAIMDVREGFVGEVALDRREGGAELSYWVRRDLWGQGIATTAVREFVEKIENSKTMIKVFASTQSGNGPSIRVLEKSGFKEAFPAAESTERYFVRPSLIFNSRNS